MSRKHRVQFSAQTETKTANVSDCSGCSKTSSSMLLDLLCCTPLYCSKSFCGCWEQGKLLVCWAAGLFFLVSIFQLVSWLRSPSDCVIAGSGAELEVEMCGWRWGRGCHLGCSLCSLLRYVWMQPPFSSLIGSLELQEIGCLVCETRLQVEGF